MEIMNTFHLTEKKRTKPSRKYPNWVERFLGMTLLNLGLCACFDYHCISILGTVKYAF